MEATIFYFITAGFLIWASYEDTKRMILPSDLTRTFITVGLAMTIYKVLMSEISLYTLYAHIIGLLGCFGITYVLYHFGVWKGGDVKLSAGIGITLGFINGMVVITFAIVLFGILAVSWLVGHLFIGNNIKDKWKKIHMPFAPVLLASFSILLSRGAI